ncbi:MAG: IclR family transcriptional regulator [Mesorhizobium sp.]|uniref:IclR family transcriptional regulator n=1 Tax=Mesorhizobium sp. TaxID=1871066 RepID=UPI000FE5516C|nr:IclR family transcriptional regulator [Mesorhizobium sp.]RWI57091.1 MAG: IclR family transcriptional regulator [Mesorhizobium sp.]
MSVENTPLYVKSVEKAFQVLQAFRGERPSLSLAEIAMRTGLDRSAAQRFVFTLHALGHLIKDGSRHYRLSPLLLEFGFIYLDTDPLIATSQEPLRQLHMTVGKNVMLARLAGNDIVLVERLTDQATRHIRVGVRLPVLYTASGRVILAHMPESEWEPILATSAFHRFTEASVVDPDEMRAIIRQARIDGYCITRSQHFNGDLSVAAPVFDSSGSVIASVSVTTLEFGQPDTARETQLRGAVVDCARFISQMMGAPT